MISTAVFMDILALRRQGLSMHYIARKMGIHRSTVKRYLESKVPPKYCKHKRKGSILNPSEVLNTSDLPTGGYTFYFGVDGWRNGKLDEPYLYYDSVEVNITP